MCTLLLSGDCAELSRPKIDLARRVITREMNQSSARRHGFLFYEKKAASTIKLNMDDDNFAISNATQGDFWDSGQGLVETCWARPS